MARVYANWERLAREVLRREQQRGGGAAAPGGAAAGLAGPAPASLGKTMNIDAILQAADEIEDEDPNVARILCEQAYSMALNLDPSSEGRGVLQLKTGLMSVIKQKIAKKDGTTIDRQRDIERLWKFYLSYKRRNRVDDIQDEQQRLRESGTFSANLGEVEARAAEMKRIYTTLRALIDVLEVLVVNTSTEGGRAIMEEVKKIKKSDATLRGELTPYNIVPLDAQSLTNSIGFFPEAAREHACRARTAPAAEETGEAEIPTTPPTALASTSRSQRPLTPDYVTREEHRTCMTSLTQQLSFLMSLNMQQTHKIVGDQAEYEAVLSAAQIDATRHHEAVLSALYPPEGVMPTPGPAFPTTFTRPMIHTSADATGAEDGEDDDDDAE